LTYATTEPSAYDGEPYFLYTFTKGSTINRFTSHNQDIEYSGNTYTASSIRHQAINQSGELERVSMEVVFPKSSSFASTFFTPNYSDVQTLTILRFHHGVDSGFEVMWKGRVISYEARGDEVILTCESIQTTMRNAGLRGKFHRSCRHALYDNSCGLNINDFYIDATVSSVEGFVVTVTVGSSDDQEAGYFKGGVFEQDGEFSFIRKHEIDTNGDHVLTLQYLIEGLGTSESVRIAPGCDLSKTTCVNKFDNVVNFGGFPYIPNKNPFTGNAGERVD